MKICDHTSVGMIVWQEDKLLLIERARKPFGFAPPAGHVDADILFEDAAKRELYEEVGLTAVSLKFLKEGRKENHCRREGGTWHQWKIFWVETTGEIKRSEDETKQAGFVNREEVEYLMTRTEKYLNKEITEEEWEKAPGIEPVWYDWFKEMKIV
jgi:ADP-ribose pyrophosphatase YjhB (NUDIX family)